MGQLKNFTHAGAYKEAVFLGNAWPYSPTQMMYPKLVSGQFLLAGRGLGIRLSGLWGKEQP